MSLGYADRLSFREDLGGRLGDPELHDSDQAVASKVAQLATWVSAPLVNALYRLLSVYLPPPPSFPIPYSNAPTLQVREAGSVIAFTGAGISTACGIPDFRGPNGVWTCQRAARPPPRLTTSFVAARPSLTHQANAQEQPPGLVE